VILDHLWQSTLFSLAAFLLVQAFRNNRAQVRYGIWLTASVKFLVPFPLMIIAAGSYVGLSSSTAIRGPLFLIDQVAQPFHVARPPLDASGLGSAAIASIVAVWACGVALICVRWVRSWKHARRILRESICSTEDRVAAALRRLGAGDLPVYTTRHRIDPGVFGIFRPVILLSEAVSGALDDDELEGVLAHEVTHVRRRDNVIAALQQLIQAIFWFHPLVWGIGVRLLEERERVCDEAALKRVQEPQTYARAILRMCEISAETRLPCVAGIGRTSLRKRIEDIMMNRTGIDMGIGRKCLLVIAAIAAVMLPLAAGIVATARHSELPPLAVARLSPQVSSASVRWAEEDVAYIISTEERAAFLTLRTDEERQFFIDQFWTRRDPTPATAANEFKDEHYRRVATANLRFAYRDMPGWRTDRGRVFIQWGPPDALESHPEGGTYDRPVKDGGGTTRTFPFELWLYRFIEGTGNDVIVEFVDPSRTGDFVRAEPR
jgi:GWxTD domain-containing protein